MPMGFGLCGFDVLWMGAAWYPLVIKVLDSHLLQHVAVGVLSQV